MDIKIYPNPTKGVLKIDISGIAIDQQVELQLYNVEGIVILKEYINYFPTEINITGQPAGHYFLQIIPDDTVQSTWKIIKE